MSYTGCGRCGGFLLPGETCPCEFSSAARRDVTRAAEPFLASCPGCSGRLPHGQRWCGCGWRQDGRGSRTAAARTVEVPPLNPWQARRLLERKFSLPLP